MANPPNPGDVIADWNEEHGVAGVTWTTRRGGTVTHTNEEIREIFKHPRMSGDEKMRLYTEAMIAQGAKFKRPKGKRIYTPICWEWRQGYARLSFFTVIARTDLGNETTLSYADIKRKMIRVG